MPKFNNVMFSRKSVNWNTPLDLFLDLNKEFNFTLDPCASSDNLGIKFFNELDNGLIQSWANNNVFCNPPYCDNKLWVEKCFNEWISNNIDIVLLIPARTDTKYFHKYILPYCELRFIKGRLKFNGSTRVAPFPSMICIYHRRNYE